MKFTEVLPFLSKGKKLKRINSDYSIQYVKKYDELWILIGKDNTVYCTLSDFLSSKDWEIVE